MNACVPCAAGKYSVGGSDSCTTCGKAQISREGASSCVSCLPGTVPNGPNGVDCIDCEAGKAAAFGSTECKECNGPGEYSQAKAAFCSIAASGQRVSSKERDSVDVCPQDHFSPGGVNDCSECEDTTFSETEAASCFSCLPGKTFNYITRECSTCEIGKIALSGTEVRKDEEVGRQY